MTDAESTDVSATLSVATTRLGHSFAFTIFQSGARSGGSEYDKGQSEDNGGLEELHDCASKADG
jgi:hypothetical protein